MRAIYVPGAPAPSGRDRPRRSGALAHRTGVGDPMPFRCSVLTTPCELEALRAAWDDLLGRSAADGPMLSPLWLLAWWRVFGGSRAGAGSRSPPSTKATGSSASRRSSRGRTGTAPGIPFRRLELLGHGRAGGGRDSAPSTSASSPSAAPRRPSPRASPRRSSEGALGPWDELVARRRSTATSPIAALARRRALRARRRRRDRARGAGLLHRAAADLRRVPARLSPSSRYLVTRSLRDFERWAGGGAELRVAATPAELEEGRRALVALHGERWGGRRRLRLAALPRLPRRGDAGAPRRGARSSCRGSPCAASPSPRRTTSSGAGRVYFYQSGRRLDVPAEPPPGHRAARARRPARHRGGPARVRLPRGRARATSASSRPRAGRWCASARCARGAGCASARALLAEGGTAPRRAPLRSALRARAPETGEAGAASRGRRGARPTARAGGGAPRRPQHAPLLRRDGRAHRGALVRPRRADASSRGTAGSGGSSPRRRRRSGAPRSPISRALGKLLPGPAGPLLRRRRHAAARLAPPRASCASTSASRSPRPTRVEALVDKRRFAALARELELPVPRTVASTERRDAPRRSRAVLPPPVDPQALLPPRLAHARRRCSGLGVGPVKALYAGDPSASSSACSSASRRSRPSFVVQEYIPGRRGAGLQLPRLPRRRGGRPLGHYVGRKIRTYPRARRGQHLPRARATSRSSSRAGLRRPRAARPRRRGQARLQARPAHRALLPARGQPALQPVEPPRRGLGREPPAPRLPRSRWASRRRRRRPRGSACAGSRSPTTRAPSSATSRPRASSRSPAWLALAARAQGLRRLRVGRRLALRGEPAPGGGAAPGLAGGPDLEVRSNT